MDLSGINIRNDALKLGRDEELVLQLENYANNLILKKLPVIYTGQHLALIIGKEYEEFKNIFLNRAEMYNVFEIKKSSGGVRRISAPNHQLKEIQYWIKVNILDKLEFPDYVTAYVTKKSILNNALPHVGKDLVMKFDLSDYFGSITEWKVYKAFNTLGYSKSLSIDLAKLCCASLGVTVNVYNKSTKEYKKVNVSTLPQGACTSPGISNLVSKNLDIKLNALSEQFKYQYTRYADDLTFSGELERKIWKSAIRQIIVEEGFKLNERKGSYRHKGTNQIVTGLNVNTKVSVPKRKRKQIYSHLHNCIQVGPFEHLKKSNKAYLTNYRDWLLGNILFIYSIQPEVGKKMKAKFDMINWI